MPTKFMLGAVAMLANSRSQFPYFRDQFVSRKPFKVFVHIPTVTQRPKKRQICRLSRTRETPPAGRPVPTRRRSAVRDQTGHAWPTARPQSIGQLRVVKAVSCTNPASCHSSHWQDGLVLLRSQNRSRGVYCLHPALTEPWPIGILALSA